MNKTNMMKIIVGITGASGAVLGVELLKALKRSQSIETHLIVSDAAKKTLSLEEGLKVEDIIVLADHHYDVNDLGAIIAGLQAKCKLPGGAARQK